MKLVYTPLFIVCYLPIAALGEYRISVAPATYKSTMYHTLYQQREFLFKHGFPQYESQIKQDIDIYSSDIKIQFSKHINRFISIKASYLTGTEYSLSSSYVISETLEQGNAERNVEIRDKFEINIKGISLGFYSELPLRRYFALGMNSGVLVSQLTTYFKVSGTAEDTTGFVTLIDEKEKNRQMEINPYFGIYAGIRFSDAWAINLEWNRYFNLGENREYPALVNISGEMESISVENEYQIDSYSLGIEYKFR